MHDEPFDYDRYRRKRAPTRRDTFLKLGAMFILAMAIGGSFAVLFGAVMGWL